MKLEDIREAYYTHSGNASKVSRQASFAGIALIWIFKSQNDSLLMLPNDLLWPTLCLAISLSFDLLQYMVSSAIWGIFNTVNENKFGHDYEGDIGASNYFNWPALFFFWGKLLFVLFGYSFIVAYMYSNIKFV